MTSIVILEEEECMATAGVSELKARLSDYLDKVKAGAEVLITDRGRPVARLVPIRRAKHMRPVLSKMEKQGLIRLGTGKIPKDFWRMPRPEDPQGLVLQALLEERREGR